MKENKKSQLHPEPWLTPGCWKFKLLTENVSNSSRADWVSGGGWPVDAGGQVDGRLIKNDWSGVSRLYELMPCQSGSPWKRTEVSVKPCSRRKLLTQIIHRYSNTWILKRSSAGRSSLMNSVPGGKKWICIRWRVEFTAGSSTTINHRAQSKRNHTHWAEMCLRTWSIVYYWLFFLFAVVEIYQIIFVKMFGIIDETSLSLSHLYT